MKKIVNTALTLALCLLLVGCTDLIPVDSDPEPDPPPPPPQIEYTDYTTKIVRDSFTNVPIYEFNFQQDQYTDNSCKTYVSIRNISLYNVPFTFQIDVWSTSSGLSVYSFQDYIDGVPSGTSTGLIYVSGTRCLLTYHDIWINMQF